MVTSILIFILVIPFQMAIGLYLMYSFIGFSFVAGLAVIVLMSTFNYFIGKFGLK